MVKLAPGESFWLLIVAHTVFVICIIDFAVMKIFTHKN